MQDSIIEDAKGKRPITAEEIEKYLKDAANAPALLESPEP